LILKDLWKRLFLATCGFLEKCKGHHLFIYGAKNKIEIATLWKIAPFHLT
jgi:hypothetical protein